MANLIALPSGTELVGDYRIERVLGAGGFGVTYLADEIALNRLVTIKEYFPSDIAARSDGIEAAPRSQDCAGDYRWGLDRFIEEAQTLAKFNHPNIVRVYRYFRGNNTGYMVLHFEEGQSLKSWLKALGRAPRQKELDALIAPLLDALEFVHQSDFLHRDIAPDNIIIRKTGDPVLIDFGSARGEIASHTKTVSALVKPGYSPYEQYAETSRRQGPWTDIYALGSTLYHAVTGKRPPDAPSRMVNDEIVPVSEGALSSYRPGFLKAIDRALVLNIEGRPQSIAAWRGDLLAPDPPRTGWLTRKANEKKQREEEAAAAEPAAPAATAAVTLPLPDAPGPKGGMLDFFEGLRKKPSGGAPAKPRPEPAVAAEAAAPAADKAPAADRSPSPDKTPAAANAPPAARSPAVAKPQRSLMEAVKARVAGESAASPKPKPKPAAKRKKAKPAPTPVKAARAAIPRNRALVEVRPPRPRPVRGSRRRWISLAFKLLVGVGVASAAVAMQDRFPKYESRGISKPSSERVERSPIVAPMTEFAAHSGPVTGLGYSDDGRWIVTAGRDATLKVWDATYHNLVRTIELDDGRATALALFGTRALTGHADGRVVMWDLERADKIASVQSNEASIWAVVFTGDKDHFAVASHDWKVTLWDARQPAAPLHVLEGHKNAVQALAYSPKRMQLASGSADKTVRLWNLQTLKLRRRYRGNRDFVTATAFSPNGRMLAGGSLDGSIKVWSALSSRRLRSLSGHKAAVTDLVFTRSGDVLISASEDGTVRVWDLNGRRTLRALPGHTGGATAVAIAPDGQHLASAGADGNVRLWSMPLSQIAKD
jgi:serine/threonine protein kinase